MVSASIVTQTLMPRFITFTPNPALDIATSVDQLVDAHKLRCDAPQVHPGGGGINVARVLHRLGADVLALYAAGGSTGARVHALLQAEGVPDDALAVATDTRESFTVHERSSGREYRFVLPGPNLSASDWQACLARLDALEPFAAWVVSSGSLPPGVGNDGHAQVARLAQRRGARAVVDSAGPALQAALQAGVWLCKPSLRELADLVGSALHTPMQQKQAAQTLIAQGQAHMVALSLGGEGAMLVTAQDCLLAEALPVVAASSVGAGDSFLGGLVWALDAGHTFHEALATAVAAGTSAVMAKGTTLCQADAVRSLRQQVRIRTL